MMERSIFPKVRFTVNSFCSNFREEIESTLFLISQAHKTRARKPYHAHEIITIQI